MKKENLIRLFMMQTVFAYAKANEAITGLIEAFDDAIDNLEDIINQILGLGSQPASIGGTQAQKKEYRTRLNNNCSNIMKAARGYFISVNDMYNAEQINISPSRIKQISDKQIVMRAQYWILVINPFVEDLEDWGITPNSISVWEQSIADYNFVYELPKTQLEERKQRTGMTNLLISQGMDYCRNILDAAAIGFKTNGNLAFYNQYMGYRLLTPVASRHGKLRVLIINELNQPIVNAIIKQDLVQNQIATDLSGQASLDIKYSPATPETSANNLYSFTITQGIHSINSGLIEIKRNQTITRTYVMAQNGFTIPAYEPKPVLA